ncbi:signal peptidase I [Nocardia higoensis]|uniref:signal peptidase I n=1 Tax=Nocardia higoensis TaxID=228599 RepID=UPI000302AEC5|nr:signal peptidase I [Nocardia higoensis]
MGEHRWWAAGAAAAVIVIFGVADRSGALWRAEAAIDGGVIRSGTLALRVGGADEQIRDFAFAGFGGADLAPAQSVQKPLTIRNAGDVEMRYRLQNVRQRDSRVPLTLRAWIVGDAASCPDAAEPAGAAVYNGPMSGAQAPPAPAWAPALAPGAIAVWCPAGDRRRRRRRRNEYRGDLRFPGEFDMSAGTDVVTGSAEDTGWGWWIRTVLGWLGLFLVLAFLALTILVPALVGGHRFTILTGSMRPTYPPGTLVVVRPVEPAELGVGSPITYQLESGRGEVVTHRVISIRRNAVGEYGFHTQGDANEVPDEKVVRPEQVRGAVWYSIPYLGYVNNWLSGQRRAFVVALMVTVLIGYAFYNIAAETRDRVRARRGGDGAAPGECGGERPEDEPRSGDRRASRR